MSAPFVIVSSFAYLRAAVRHHGHSERVAERILRLNPKFEPGKVLRGWRPSSVDARLICLMQGYVTKGEFMRKFGRAAFEALPVTAIRKNGRRKFVTYEAVEDESWRRGNAGV